MSTNIHNNEPRDLGYNKEFNEFIKECIKNRSNTIFEGLTQADFFMLAFALGINRNQKSDVKNKVNNIPVDRAFSEEMKWSLLSYGISNDDLYVLKNEKSVYLESEKYANEGIQIIKSRMEKEGSAFSKWLESELIEFLTIFEKD